MITHAIVIDTIAEPPRPGHDVTDGGLVSRLLRTIAAAGIENLVVVGEAHRRSCFTAAADDSAQTLTFVEVPQGTPDGMMVLCARPHLRGPALCLSSDHLLSREFVATLQEAPRVGNHVILAVDGDVAQERQEASTSRVALEGEMVTGMGAPPADDHPLFTGALVTAPALFAELARLELPTLREALERLASQRSLRAFDIAGALWQRTDTESARARAEWMLRLVGDDLTAAPPPSAPPRDPHHTLEHIRAVLAQKDVRHYVLMNPGPVTTTATVKSALIHHDVCHRDSDYADVVLRIERKLKRVFRAGPEHTVVTLTGSGTAAMEAAISSCIPPEQGLLVIDNGAFGARLAEVAAVHEIPVTKLTYPWGELPEVADVERALDADPGIAAVAMIHHETSVGLLNPVSAVGALCRARGKLLIVDAVSSLGGEDVDVSRDNIDVCLSSANKCLHAVSGISFVCVHDRVWQLIEDVRPRVFYLDLKRYRRYLRGSGETPFTPAVSTFFALDTALDELIAEGVGRRRQRYGRWNRRIRARLLEAGCEPLSTTGHESRTITVAKLPDGITFDLIYPRIKARGFIIYNCKDELKDRYIQIANMGDLSDDTIERFLDAFVESLEQVATPKTATVGHLQSSSLP